MKIIIPASILLAIIAVALPFFASGGTSEPSPEPSATPQITATAPPAAVATPLASYELNSGYDSAVELKLHTDGGVLELNMSDYLVGVVAAEMPANFYDEALKAQAVAARTDTYYRMGRSVSDGVHPNAGVCDNPMHCKAWLSDAALRDKWGAKYGEYIAKITAAVAATDGLCAVYEDKPILAVFHSSSGGYTEDSANVWNESLPYLQSVQSPEGPASVPDFVTEAAYSLAEFRRIALEKYPDMVLADSSAEKWFGAEERSETGRLISVTLGGVKLSGTELRMLFGLRSAVATWAVSETEIRFTVRGYGHGVGMSQFGANEFARNGANFEDILKYFYKGIDVKIPGNAA